MPGSKYWIIYVTNHEMMRLCEEAIGHKPSFEEFKNWSGNNPNLWDIIVASLYPDDMARSVEYALSRQINRPCIIEIVEKSN